uniref:TDP43_N domain-containing protein n=1 Tax=Rhabditophanes sp. KR3021 TaxID=114890 RepID=A0AC35TT81_9BILA
MSSTSFDTTLFKAIVDFEVLNYDGLELQKGQVKIDVDKAPNLREQMIDFSAPIPEGIDFYQPSTKISFTPESPNHPSVIALKKAIVQRIEDGSLPFIEMDEHLRVPDWWTHGGTYSNLKQEGYCFSYDKKDTEFLADIITNGLDAFSVAGLARCRFGKVKHCTDVMANFVSETNTLLIRISIKVPIKPFYQLTSVWDFIPVTPKDLVSFQNEDAHIDEAISVDDSVNASNGQSVHDSIDDEDERKINDLGALANDLIHELDKKYVQEKKIREDLCCSEESLKSQYVALLEDKLNEQYRSMGTMSNDIAYLRNENKDLSSKCNDFDLYHTSAVSRIKTLYNKINENSAINYQLNDAIEELKAKNTELENYIAENIELEFSEDEESKEDESECEEDQEESEEEEVSEDEEQETSAQKKVVLQEAAVKDMVPKEVAEQHRVAKEKAEVWNEIYNKACNTQLVKIADLKAELKDTARKARKQLEEDEELRSQLEDIIEDLKQKIEDTEIYYHEKHLKVLEESDRMHERGALIETENVQKVHYLTLDNRTLQETKAEKEDRFEIQKMENESQLVDIRNQEMEIANLKEEIENLKKEIETLNTGLHEQSRRLATSFEEKEKLEGQALANKAHLERFKIKVREMQEDMNIEREDHNAKVAADKTMLEQLKTDNSAAMCLLSHDNEKLKQEVRRQRGEHEAALADQKSRSDEITRNDCLIMSAQREEIVEMMNNIESLTSTHEREWESQLNVYQGRERELTQHMTDQIEQLKGEIVNVYQEGVKKVDEKEKIIAKYDSDLCAARQVITLITSNFKSDLNHLKEEHNDENKRNLHTIELLKADAMVLESALCECRKDIDFYINKQHTAEEELKTSKDSINVLTAKLEECTHTIDASKEQQNYLKRQICQLKSELEALEAEFNADAAAVSQEHKSIVESYNTSIDTMKSTIETKNTCIGTLENKLAQCALNINSLSSELEMRKSYFITISEIHEKQMETAKENEEYLLAKEAFLRKSLAKDVQQFPLTKDTDVFREVVPFLVKTIKENEKMSNENYMLAKTMATAIETYKNKMIQLVNDNSGLVSAIKKLELGDFEDINVGDVLEKTQSTELMNASVPTAIGIDKEHSEDLDCSFDSFELCEFEDKH